MSKTEQAIREAVTRKGHYVGVGKRAYAAVEKLQAANAFPLARYSYHCFNANGPQFRSQWKSPRCRTQYEVAITLPSRADFPTEADFLAALGPCGKSKPTSLPPSAPVASSQQINWR